MAKKRKPSDVSLFDAPVDVDTPSGPSDEAVALHEAALRMGINLFVYAVTSRPLP